MPTRLITPQIPGTHNPDTRIARLLAGLWQRNQPQVLERLALLDQAAAALATGALPSALHRQATETAHNLAGTLGMFGHPAATELARQLEATYDTTQPDPTLIQTLTLQLRQSLYPA